MKKTISLLLAFVFLFTAASPCFANEVTIQQIDTALMERGCPEEVLQTMPDEQKYQIYNDADLVYVDSFSIDYTESTADSQIEGTQPRGQIAASRLNLYFIIFADISSSQTLEHLYVTFNYNWESLPLIRLQDPIAISWDETKFRLEDNSFVKKDMYSGYYIDYSSNAIGDVCWVYDQVISQEYGYANAGPSGVSWYADIAYPLGRTATELYGYGSFTLVPAHGATVPSGTTSTLYAHYIHPTISFGLSIAVKTYGTFNISGGGVYDERGTQQTFTIP